MNLQLHGLHHVSAITSNPSRNVAFYTDVLGMRLVKKTVNQDDVTAYHLFYGDELGNPGTEVTFFAFANAISNRPGSGMIDAIGLSVPNRAALDWWQQRFDGLGIDYRPTSSSSGRATLPFIDPEGQKLELVAADNVETNTLPGSPWQDSPVPEEYQIRGLDAVRIIVAHLQPTAQVLTTTLGFQKSREFEFSGAATDNPETVHVFDVAHGGPGTEIQVIERPEAPRGRVGAGGVHHLAFRTPNDEEHQAWQQHIDRAGLHVTPQIDRYYFRSIYFREPGGILYEIATDGPGFATDEDVEHLGENLALPPFLEPQRASIEAGLEPIKLQSYEQAKL